MVAFPSGEVRFEFLRRYFSHVWPPFLVYLGLYCLAWGIHLPVTRLTTVFQVIHCVNLLLLGNFAWESHRRKPIQRDHAVFWISLLILLLWPGVYLEYPSDPWEHFRRILSWQTSPYVSENESRTRFAYFFSWTLLSWAKISQRRAALGGIAAFWQLLLAYQFGIFLKALRCDSRTRWVGITGWLCFFGTSIFGIRYYSLAATPLAMVALYGALTLVQNSLDEKAVPRQRTLVWVIPLFVLMELNHPKQELVNFALGATALYLAWQWPRLSERKRGLCFKYLLGLAALGFGLGTILAILGPARFLAIKGAHHLSFWGGLSLFSESLRIRSTLGLAGWLGAIASLFLYRTYPSVALLTWVPLVTLVFPPTGASLMAVAPESGIYRLLYGFPPSVALGLWLYTFLKGRTPRNALLLTLSALGSLGLIYGQPLYGRLFFQLYRPDELQSLVPLDTTANWFWENRRHQVREPTCRVLADDVTYFSLATQFGLPLFGLGRLNPIRELIVLSETQDPVENLVERKVCGVLMPDRSRMPKFTESFIGHQSGHWRRNLVDLNYFLPENEERLIFRLEEIGWLPTEVPPFFWYWEPNRRK